MQTFPRYVSRVSSSGVARMLFALTFICAMLVVPSGMTTSMVQAAGAPQTPLASMLKADGSLNLGTGWSGSLDPSGWTMTTDANGAPRFVRTPEGGPTTTARTTLAAVPGDDKWDDRFGLPGVAYSGVYALAVSESDVYVGGYFTQMGGVAANHVAKWNGRSWSSLAQGTSGTVYALAVSGNLVYAGGDFATAGTATVNSMAVWNGSVWKALGGVWSGSSRGTVRALALANGNLFVGGSFDKVGTVTAYGIAKWNNGWRTLGSGVGSYYSYNNSISGGSVYAIAVAYPKVYVGGYFREAIKGTTPVIANSVAVWNDTTSTWAAFGRGVGMTYDNGASMSLGTVNAIVVNGADVVVGGDFAYAGNATGGANVNSIAKWRNGWSALGNGVTTNWGRGTVKALAMYGTRMIVGGNFTSAGGIAMPYVAQWVNNTWSAMKGGTNGEIYALAVAANGMYAGGDFDTAATSNVNNIARWTGATWATLGEGISTGTCCGTINAIAIDASGNVYAGGAFTSAGSLVTNNIAMWNGTTWNALGAGVVGGYSSAVNTIAVSGNNVFVGGNFSTAGTTSANNVAVWNRATKAWARLGAGVNGPVYSFAVNGSLLYVGGQFTGAGTTDAENIARWNGTTWSKLGNGLDFNSGSVRALALYGAGRYVIAGGDFSSVNVVGGSVRVNALLLWDSTTPNEWYLPGNGVTSRCYNGDCAGYVYALAVIGGDLFVGGNFDKAGTEDPATPYQDVVVAHSIVRLNLPSDRWYSLGGDVVGGGEQVIHSLAAAGKELFVGGNFATVANKTANSIAKWSTATSSWTTLGSGMASNSSYSWPTVNALAASGAAVFVGGNFVKSGGKAASNFAKWGTAPNVAVNPGFDQADATGWATGWTKATGATRATTPKRTGLASLKQSATNNSSFMNTQTIANLAGGRSYTVSAWVSIPATTDAFQWVLDVQWRNGTTNIGVPIVVNRVSATTNSAWTQVLNTLIAPAGTTNAIVRLNANNLNATVYVDDVVFSTETAPPATAATTSVETDGSAAEADAVSGATDSAAALAAPALDDQPLEQTTPPKK